MIDLFPILELGGYHLVDIFGMKFFANFCDIKEIHQGLDLDHLYYYFFSQVCVLLSVQIANKYGSLDQTITNGFCICKVQ